MTPHPAPSSDPQPVDWLDLDARALEARHQLATRRLIELSNEMVAMEGALEALERHPEATTAREACRLDCLMFQSLLVA